MTRTLECEIDQRAGLLRDMLERALDCGPIDQVHTANVDGVAYLVVVCANGRQIAFGPDAITDEATFWRVFTTVRSRPGRFPGRFVVVRFALTQLAEMGGAR